VLALGEEDRRDRSLAAQVVAQADHHVQQVAHQHHRRESIVAAELGRMVAVGHVVLRHVVVAVERLQADLVQLLRPPAVRRNQHRAPEPGQLGDDVGQERRSGLGHAGDEDVGRRPGEAPHAPRSARRGAGRPIGPSGGDPARGVSHGVRVTGRVNFVFVRTKGASLAPARSGAIRSVLRPVCCD